MHGTVNNSGLPAILKETSACSTFSYCYDFPISGPSHVCASNENPVTLTDGYSGGTWTSSNTSIATVGLSSGIVHVVTVGTFTITYTDVCGRTTTHLMTVDPVPTFSAPSPIVCEGSSIVLNSTPSSGTWSSTVPGVASMYSSSARFRSLIASRSAFILLAMPYDLQRSLRSRIRARSRDSPRKGR